MESIGDHGAAHHSGNPLPGPHWHAARAELCVSPVQQSPLQGALHCLLRQASAPGVLQASHTSSPTI